MEIYIAGFISLIVLIVFFYMAANLSAIKKSLIIDKRKDAWVQYCVAVSLGDKDAAYRHLLYIVYAELTAVGDDGVERSSKNDKLEARYEQDFERLGKSYPKIDL